MIMNDYSIIQPDILFIDRCEVHNSTMVKNNMLCTYTTYKLIYRNISYNLKFVINILFPPQSRNFSIMQTG